MALTTDHDDPRLTHGVDDECVPQAEAYLILSKEERKKGLVRPLRRSYRHVGPAGPQYALLDLTTDQQDIYKNADYVKYERYPESALPMKGRYWKQSQLDHVDKGCGQTTTMGLELCETYARQPSFYGSTYCVSCQKHLPVAEFVWVEDGERVGS